MVAQWWRIRLPMQEIQVRSLSQEDSLDKEMAIHSSIPYSSLGNPTDRGAWRSTLYGVVKELDTT